MTARRQKTTLIYIGFPGSRSKSAELWTRPVPGIWWAVDDVVVALLQLPERAERSGPLLDSTLEHWREWPTVATLFGRSRKSDYFTVPRGRVLLGRKTGGGVIYHGNETSAATLLQVARAFNLTQWKEALDEHYLMGDEADELFSD